MKIQHPELFNSLLHLFNTTEAWSEEMAKTMPGCLRGLGFVQEFRTIRFGMGRRMGHTQMAVQLIGTLERKAIYLTPSDYDHRKILVGLPGYRKDLIKVVGSQQCESTLRGVSHTLLVVDPASMIGRKTLRRFVEVMTPNHPMVVLLG